MNQDIFAQGGLQESGWGDIIIEAIQYQTLTINQFRLLLFDKSMSKSLKDLLKLCFLPVSH